LQPRYLLQAAFVDSDDVGHAKIEYVGDFQYQDKLGATICEDVKGCRTAVFDLKWKLVKRLFPAVRFVTV
jgi:hypothetical protein